MKKLKSLLSSESECETMVFSIGAFLIDLILAFRVILDASARRFQAYKIYLRVTAAKNSIIEGDTLKRRSQLNEFAEWLQKIDATLQRVRVRYHKIILPLVLTVPSHFLGTWQIF